MQISGVIIMESTEKSSFLLLPTDGIKTQFAISLDLAKNESWNGYFSQ